MRALLVVLLIFGLSSSAFAEQWKAKDGSTIDVYGSPASEEWEAFIDQTEYCTPTGPIGHAVLQLHCGDAPPEDVTKSKGGVMFRGKFYARVN